MYRRHHKGEKTMSPTAPRSRPQAVPPSRIEALTRTLTADILDGRRPVGSALPTEASLAGELGVGVAAARSAVRQLETLGLVARSRGGAVRIVSGEIRATYAITSAGLSVESGYSGATQVVMERQRHVTADTELAMMLGVGEGTQWLHLTGLRTPYDASLGPLSWIDVWLGGDTPGVPHDIGYAVADIAALTGGSVGAVHEDISAGLLTPAQARQLRARSGTAGLHVLRRFCRPTGSVVAAVRDVHPADRITVSIRAPRRPG
jgi:DNA-binding GntR family transcriptional regulator